ncbi:MAG: hypothetical protein H8K10_18125 [Nitrospira sp.]|nr:hypothetical protein [Nitrospira sp.]
MLRQLSLVLLCCAGLTACGESGGSAGSDIKLVGEWAKIGETDNYLYYDDPASIKKTDDTVVTLDLFDYKSAQTEGGSTPTLSKATEREYDCQNKKSQPLKSNWYSGQMGAGIVVRSAGTSNRWSAATLGTATGGLLKAACGNS